MLVIIKAKSSYICVSARNFSIILCKRSLSVVSNYLYIFIFYYFFYFIYISGVTKYIYSYNCSRFVCNFFFISCGSMQKVFSSISAKTGMQFQCNIAVAVAHIVHGVTMISSPGSTLRLPTAAINPEVHELTEIAYFTL